jgi:hypothetical protein
VVRWLGWYFVAYGLCFCAGAIAGHDLVPRLLDLIGGAGTVLLGAASLAMVPRNLRRKASMALAGK